MATARDDVVVVERPRRGRGLRILIGLILLAVVAAVVAIVIVATKESDDAKDDVSIQSCEADSGGGQPTDRWSGPCYDAAAPVQALRRAS